MDAGKILIISAPILITALVAAIFFVITEIRKRKFENRNRKFQEILQDKVGKIESEISSLKLYLNGIPGTKNRYKQKAFISAIDELNNYNYDSAIRLFEEYLNQFSVSESERCAILNFIGMSQFKKGEYNEALKRANEMILIAERIKDKEALCIATANKCVALDELGRHEEALSACEKAIELKPDFAGAWCNKGVALINLDRYEEALSACEKAIELKPNFALAWYNKACAYSLKGEKENVLRHLSKAIELDPNYKENAKTEENFKNLWDDPEFKTITS